MIFTAYQVHGWRTMITGPVKSQQYGRYVREILLKISWNTQLKHSKPCKIILQKVKKPPDGFYTCIFFASAIILIFGGLFLHRLSRLLEVDIKWIRFLPTYFVWQHCRNRRENTNWGNPSWNARKRTPKGHTKDRPFCFYKMSKGGICHILYSIVESSEQVVFYSDGSSVIADNSCNAQIFS